MYQNINHRHAEAVNISSADHVLTYTSVIWVGTGGASATLKVTTLGGEDVTFTGVLSGTVLPVLVTKVFKTGTDASNMVALAE